MGGGVPPAPAADFAPQPGFNGGAPPTAPMQQPGVPAMTNQFAQMGFNHGQNAPRPAHDTHTINLVNLPLNPLELMTTMPPEINLPPNVRVSP